MLDEREIETEIARLENTELSYANCAKLADLYIIQNQLQRQGVIDTYADTEFLTVANGKSIADVLMIMDELMSTLQAVNTKVYNRIINKINNL